MIICELAVCLKEDSPKDKYLIHYDSIYYSSQPPYWVFLRIIILIIMIIRNYVQAVRMFFSSVRIPVQFRHHQ